MNKCVQHWKNLFGQSSFFDKRLISIYALINLAIFQTDSTKIILASKEKQFGVNKEFGKFGCQKSISLAKQRILQNSTYFKLNIPGVQQLMGKITSLVNAFLAYSCFLMRFCSNSNVVTQGSSPTYATFTPFIQVQRGNCTDLYIELGAPPTTDVSIDFTPPFSGQQLFRFTNSSNYKISFNSTEKNKTTQICSSNLTIEDEVTVSPLLEGTDASDYYLVFSQILIVITHKDWVIVPVSVAIWQGSCLQYTSTYQSILLHQSPLTVSFNSSLSDISHLFVYPNNKFTFPGGINSQTFYICTSLNAPLGNSTLYPYLSGSGSENFQMILPFINVSITERTLTPKLYLPLTDSYVPQGGCSVPFNAQLSIAPTSDLKVEFGVQIANSQQVSLLYLKDSPTPDSIIFEAGTRNKKISFCANSDIRYDIDEIKVNVTLSGTNASDYTINYNMKTYQVMQFIIINPRPLYKLTIFPNASTNGLKMNITTTSNRQSPSMWLRSSLKSYFVWVQSEKPFTNTSYFDQIDFPDGEPTIFNNYSEKQGYIYLSSREVYAYRTFQMFAGKNTTAYLVATLPDTDYTFCLFIEDNSNSHGDDNITFGSCQTFRSATLPWPIYKAVLNFERQITLEQMQNLICFTNHQINATYNQTSNQHGVYCKDPNSVPIPNPGLFSGEQISPDNTTTIYLKTQDEDSTSEKAIKFIALFNPTNMSDLIHNIKTALGVTLINVSTAKTNFSDMRGTNLELKIQFEVIQDRDVKLSEISANGTGVLYLGVGQNDTPNFEQLVNCLDRLNISLSSCKRVFLNEGQQTDLILKDISTGQNSHLFYALANQFPYRITNVTPVQSFSIQSKKTVVSGSIYLQLTITILGLALLI